MTLRASTLAPAWLATLLMLGLAACNSSDGSTDAGSGGDGSGGSSNTGSGGSSTTGTGGSSITGTGGRTGSGGGGASSMGSGGSSNTGSGGHAGSGGNTGSGGSSGSGGTTAHDAGDDAATDAGNPGRTFSTNRDDFFGDSRCDKAGTLVCEDFESGSFDTAVWHTKFDAPAVDGMQHARGSKALHLSTDMTSGSGIETNKIFPAMNDHYFGRMFVYFDALPTSPQWAHWTVVGANPAQDSDISGEIRVGGQYDGSKNRFGVGTDGGPTGDWTNLDGDPQNAVKAVPEDEWICLEWEHDGGTDQTRFWWDGVEHTSLGTDRDVQHQGNSDVKYDLPDFGSLWVGWINYNQGKTVVPGHFDTWIDEVALDSQRIGCSL
jgi:hypothetical protein